MDQQGDKSISWAGEQASGEDPGKVILPDEAVGWIKLHRTHLSGDLKQEYARDVQSDFDQITPHLPEVTSIIDIGCGMAGIDVLLARRYPNARITLLDGDGPETNFRGGYGSFMLPFTSRAIVEETFRLNGLDRPEWKDVGTKELLCADLVFSLLSWGFHYPLATYRTRGLCVSDLRKKFPVMGSVIATTPKYNRCLWRSNA